MIDGALAGWIRPVSKQPALEEMHYKNGKTVSVLDYIDITFESHEPHNYQTENHLIANEQLFSYAGTASNIQDAIDTGPLWVNGESTLDGQNDRINEDCANTLRSSLMLIQPEKVKICMKYNFYKRYYIVRACFDYLGASYNLRVTDPAVLKKHRKKGEYLLENALFCVSLGEIYDGNAYKLVTTIFTPDMVEWE